MPCAVDRGVTIADTEKGLRYTCLKCGTENMLAPPRGCRFKKRSAPKSAVTERAVKIATRCASCMHAHEIEPPSRWRLRPLTTVERRQERAGQLGRAFTELYKRNLGVRLMRLTLSP